MIEPQYIKAALAGAASFAIAHAAYMPEDRCDRGSPRQDAIDVANYERAVLRTLRFAYDRDQPENVTLAEAAGAVSLAWYHLRQCAAERGLEFCESIGTTKEMPMYKVLRSDLQGSQPLEDLKRYRYIVPETFPGPLFEMTFWPREYEEVSIRIKFSESLGFDFFLQPTWRSCSDGYGNRFMDGAGIEYLKGGENE